MKIHFLLPVFSILMAGCRLAPSMQPIEPALIPHTYIPSDDPVLNPERGFFSSYQLPGPADFRSLREQGYTLVHLNIHLDTWRETDIPQDVLTALDANFADIRQAGLKAIIRFSYNQGPNSTSLQDASKAQILRHIEQLTPLLQKNADVIAWMEAGFIGEWGEWHSSTNGLDNIPEKREILLALLKTLPETRMVQVRYPSDIIEMFPHPRDAVHARVAHHNDCFLSSNTDLGTYVKNGLNTIERDQAYLSELTRFTPMSGETCAPNPPRSDCATALHEMVLLHFSAISAGYHEDVLHSWEEGGCIQEINRRLGYRLKLTSASFNQEIRPGGILSLTVNLENTGYSSLINERSLFVVLQGDGKTPPYIVKLNLDPRTWEPGTVRWMTRIYIPSVIPVGDYKLALWLPDEYASLRGNPLYAVRFVNENIWEKTTGFNVLGTVTVTEDAIGSYQPSETFRVLELVSSYKIKN